MDKPTAASTPVFPTGTVTFLFTDIEGSTRLLQELGDKWGDVLQDQRRLMRAALTANNGNELGTEGDSFFVVFASAEDAVQAVVSGENKGKDTFQGQSADDTGVTAVYLGPQVSFTWANKLSAQIGADLPMSIENTALQAVPDYRIRAGLTWHF